MTTAVTCHLCPSSLFKLRPVLSQMRTVLSREPAPQCQTLHAHTLSRTHRTSSDSRLPHLTQRQPAMLTPKALQPLPSRSLGGPPATPHSCGFQLPDTCQPSRRCPPFACSRYAHSQRRKFRLNSISHQRQLVVEGLRSRLPPDLYRPVPGGRQEPVAIDSKAAHLPSSNRRNIWLGGTRHSQS